MKKLVKYALIIGSFALVGCSDKAIGNKDEKVNQGSSGKIAIGEKYEGGIIFYINKEGTGGLMTTPEDLTYIGGGQSSQLLKQIFLTGTYTSGREEGISSSPYGITNAKDSSLGTGLKNTMMIVEAMKEKGSAAAICDNLEFGGYNDWFLPSREEANLMFKQAKLLGMETNRGYWSSTEYNNFKAYSTSNLLPGSKLDRIRVRPVRAFGTFKEDAEVK